MAVPFVNTWTPCGATLTSMSPLLSDDEVDPIFRKNIRQVCGSVGRCSLVETSKQRVGGSESQRNRGLKRR
jgi:hypothetical protein